MSLRFYLSTLASIIVGAMLCAWYVHTSGNTIVRVASPLLYVLLVVLPLFTAGAATKWRHETVYLRPVCHDPSRGEMLIFLVSSAALALIMKLGNDLIVNQAPLWGWPVVVLGLAWLTFHMLTFNFDDPLYQ